MQYEQDRMGLGLCLKLLLKRTLPYMGFMRKIRKAKGRVSSNKHNHIPLIRRFYMSLYTMSLKFLHFTYDYIFNIPSKNRNLQVTYSFFCKNNF